MSKIEWGPAAPLALKLQVLEAERERLAADFQYVAGQLAEVDAEIHRVRKKLDETTRKLKLKRVK